MKWMIAFDAGCDLRNFAPVETADLQLVPLTILLGDRRITDDGTTTTAQMQAMLDESTGKTGTACPSVGDWQHVMEKGDLVLAVTLSGAVSGSHQSAVIARDMVLEDHPNKRIYVMDSVSGSGGMLFLVRRALELIQAGASFEEVCRGVEECRSRCEIFFLVQNVDNLVSNGRLNPIVGRALKALHLSMLSTVSAKGDMEVLHKARSFDRAMDRCLDECEKRGCTGKKVIISHCLNPDGALVMRDKLLARYPDARVEIMSTGPLCGYYAEKGGLIVALQNT